MSALGVIVDGVALPEADARAFWERFSAHMEDHRGDLAGFAKAEGFASVHPETRGGRPTLIVSKTAAQQPYANAPNRSGSASGSGGSGGPQKTKSKPKTHSNASKKPR